MTMAHSSISIHDAHPGDISAVIFRERAWFEIGDTNVFPAGQGGVLRDLAQIALIGDRLAREAREAGDRYRTELRIAQNAAARATADHRRALKGIA